MIRTYNVTGQSVDEFKDSLFMAVRHSNPLSLRIQLILDELSIRRGEHAEVQEINCLIYAIHPDPFDYFVTVQDTATHTWGTLQIKDEIITLTMVS